MTIEQAIILAGGLGTRLGNLSKGCPKSMQLINNKPFMNYIFFNLKRHGIKKILISVGYLGNKIKSYYGDGKEYGLSIKYAEESEPLGTSGALLNCKEYLEDKFFLLNGDTIFDINFLDLGKILIENKSVGVLALRKVRNAKRFGEVIIKNNIVIEFNEKKSANESLVSGGILALRKEIIKYIDKVPSSLEKDVFVKLIREKNLLAKQYDGFFIDIGIPETLKNAQTLIPNWREKSAILFDRDGVINKDKGYVCEKERFEWTEGSMRAIKKANDLGILVIIITNQSGIGRGYYSEYDFLCFMNWINSQLSEIGAHLDDWYFCPHHPIYGLGKYKKKCLCRKPQPGLLEKAINKWSLKKEKIILIGDKETDLEAARSLSIKSYLFNENDNLEYLLDNKVLPDILRL